MDTQSNVTTPAEKKRRNHPIMWIIPLISMDAHRNEVAEHAKAVIEAIPGKDKSGDMDELRYRQRAMLEVVRKWKKDLLEPESALSQPAELDPNEEPA